MKKCQRKLTFKSVSQMIVCLSLGCWKIPEISQISNVKYVNVLILYQTWENVPWKTTWMGQGIKKRFQRLLYFTSQCRKKLRFTMRKYWIDISQSMSTLVNSNEKSTYRSNNTTFRKETLIVSNSESRGAEIYQLSFY